MRHSANEIGKAIERLARAKKLLTDANAMEKKGDKLPDWKFFRVAEAADLKRDRADEVVKKVVMDLIKGM